MDLLGKVNIFTLLPKDLQYCEKHIERLWSKIFFILLLATIFVFVGTVITIIVGVCTNEDFLVERTTYIPLMTDLCRGTYYLTLLLLGKYFPVLRLIGAWSIPVVLGVSVTEAYLAVGTAERIYARQFFLPL